MKKEFNAKGKAITLSVIFILVCNLHSFAQPRTIPAPYPSGIPLNFVRTWDVTAPEPDANQLMSKQVKDAKQATQYLDGLGRPLQTVIRQGSMATGDSAKDVVNPIEYDGFGREQFKYVPFAADTTGGYQTNDGKFKLNAFKQQSAFMTSQYGYQGETFFYGKSDFESSPLNRATGSYAPGNSWVGSESNSDPAARRNIQNKYYVNTTADSVRIWNVINSSTMEQFDTYTTSAVYPAGELYKNITIDEHKKQVIEFKDKEGKILLKKVQLTASADTGTGRSHAGWTCTYYIYDELNNLRCVIQPLGVKAILNTWALDTTLLAEQCFRYEFDSKGRMIIKKVPGAGAVYMIYDARDRLVMTQDANMRQDTVKWLVTKYDALNRPTETGLWSNGYSDFVTHAIAAAESTNYPATSGNYEQLTLTHYDDYDSVPGDLSATYLTTWDGNFSSTSNSTWPYPQMPVQSTEVKGMPTWTKVKLLGTTDTYLYSVTIYDEKDRPIQVQASNITGGMDVFTTQYSWLGQPLAIVQKHEKQGTNAQTSVVVTQISYDDLSRVLKIEKKLSNTLVNGNAMPGFTTILENEYDQLGQLKKKTIGESDLETLNYEYNIRGWLNGVNNEYIKDSINGHWFGFELGYDKPNSVISNSTYSTQQYNGNISGMTWKAGGDQEKRKYDFAYDNLSRLTGADFRQKFGTDWVKTDPNNSNFTIDFSLDSLSYDYNGNILFMQQKGLRINASPVIDKMTYSYMNSGASNKLLSVTEDGSIGTTNNKLGDFTDINTGDDDYAYDANGNLIVDKNKRIDSIYYNHLNLPVRIRVSDSATNLKGIIEYTYDAIGNKLKKKTTEGAISTTTSYNSGFVYQNDTLQFTGHEEGRIRYAKKYFLDGDSTNGFFYDYFLKDHLGNVRVVLTEQKDTTRYMATMETDLREKENALFANIEECATLTSSISDYPSDPTTDPNDYTARTNGTDIQVGPAIALKVMAGDKFDIAVNSYFRHTSTRFGRHYINTQNVFNTLLEAMSLGVSSISGSKATSGELGSSGSPMYSAVETFLNNEDSVANGTDLYPFAYINWVLLDEQFRFIPEGSGFERVTLAGLETHAFLDLPVSKNGYLYVYVSNGTDNFNVYFDNLVVQHYTSPLTEETHYYPFGLTMAGISSKAMGRIQNKEKTFQGQRFDDELELDWVQFKWRNHDPQIGRFIEVDPLSEKYVYNSTYAFSENKVTNHVELEGLESVESAIADEWRKWGITDNKESVEPIMTAMGQSLLNPNTYLQAGATIGGMVGPLVLTTIMTGGFGDGAVLKAETNSLRVTTTTVRASETTLATRATEIQSVLKPATQSRTTTAVASATTAEGKTATLVASSEKTLRPAQIAALKPGETAVTGAGHAEATILKYAGANNMTVTAVAASRPICAGCATAINNAGATPASPLKVFAPPPPLSKEVIKILHQ